MHDDTTNLAPVAVAVAPRRDPPRFRWLARFGVTLLIVLIAAGVLRWRAGVHAEQRLAALFASLRAAGEPITLYDMFPPDIPDDENAAHLLHAAASLIRFDESRGNRDYSNLTFEQIESARQALDDNSPALDLLREARYRSTCNWTPWDRDRSVKNVQYRAFANAGDLLCMAALAESQDGDTTAALDYLRDALSLADALNERRFTALLGHLLAVQISGRVCQVLERMLPSMLLDCAAGSTGAEARDRLQQIRDQLLDDSQYDEACIRAMFAERASFIEGLIQSGLFPSDLGIRNRGAVSAELSRYQSDTFYPVFLMGLCDWLDLQTAQCHDVRARISGSPAPLAFPALKCDTLLAKWESFFSCLLYTAFGGTIEGRSESMLIRRLAATGIAVRLYELEHGALPLTLEALVPQYLPAVPRSPQRASSEPLRLGSDPIGWFVEIQPKPGTFSTHGRFRLSQNHPNHKHDVYKRNRQSGGETDAD